MKLKSKKFLSLMFAGLMSMQAVTSLPVFAASAGDVVINEVAWAGTADNSNDEWIELYNTTNQAINLSGWSIVDDGTSTYSLSGTIAPRSYFVIEDSETTLNSTAGAVVGLSLANSGDSLVLYDQNNIVIDTVNGGGAAWYGGNSNQYATMERIDPAVRIDSASNWATASNGNGTLGRNGGAILGTPGMANSNFAGSGPNVTFSTVSNSVNPGANFSVSVDVASVTGISAYGFDIIYDPAVLTFVSASEGNFLNNGGNTAFYSALQNGQAGQLVVGNARLGNVQGVSGNGNLFNLTFRAAAQASGNTNLMFGANSFLADNIADIAVNFSPLTIGIGGSQSTVGAVTGLTANEGQERFSINLSWNAPTSGANSYLVRKQMPDGNYVTLGSTSTTSFIDNDAVSGGGNLLSGITYTYEVITINNGIQGPAAEITASESRGIVGDIDRSDRVDGRDVQRLARAYGSNFGETNYSLTSDTNFDGLIDGSDLINIGANFAATYLAN